MKDKGVCIAAAGREENEKSSSKAAKTSQEMTLSSQEERETEEMKQRDETTRGSSIGTLPNKKMRRLKRSRMKKTKTLGSRMKHGRRTDEEITGKSSSTNDSPPNEKETRPQKIAFTVLQKTRGR